jgi:molybdate transport system permease protein
VVLAAVGAAFLVAPVLALLVRAPWRALPSIVLHSGVLVALRLSMETSTMATLVAIVLGVPLAWILARKDFRGRKLLRALVIVPLVLPPVVGGVALLLAFGREGVFGRYLFDWTGLSLPFSTAAVVIAEAFVAMPFLVITVEGGLRSVDRRFESVAATLGASPLTRFVRVTMPMIAPSLAAGALLCWARALGEFGATVTFAGAFPGRTETMPVAVYFALETDPGSAIALSLILLLISVVILVALRDRWLRSGPIT